MEDKVRLEALKELEEVRRVRTVTMQGEEMKSEVTKILEEKLTTDEGAGHEDKSNNQDMTQSLLAEKAEVESDDGKCETSHLDKGETNETRNVNDSNDSEREASNKITEAKEGNTRFICVMT